MIWAVAAAALLAAVVIAAAVIVFGFLRPDRDPAGLERQYATAPSRFVTAAGIRFHIRDRGAGPALVLLHGQSANLFAWEAAAQLLAARHRVISVDLPAHGLTGPDPQRRYSVPQLAASLDALATALGLDRFALAGNSLGGAVALEYALACPQKLAALVLLDAIGAPRTELAPFVFLVQSLPVVGRWISVLSPRWMVWLTLRSTYGDPAKVTAGEVTRTYDLLRRAGNRPAQQQMIMQIQRYVASDDLARLATPTLILWGSRDGWVRPRYASWFAARLPHATLEMLPGLGHTPMPEAPAVTAAAIEAFLDAGSA